jgi:lysophospholipase L1-like esterase
VKKYLVCIIILLSWVAFADLDKQYINMAAMGDSISTGLNALKWGNRGKQYSWSTGENSLVKSHRYFLTNDYAKEIEYFNVANSGSTSDNLLEQAEKLSDKDIDYLTFLIGANDICNVDVDEEFDLENFSANIYAATSKLIAEHPDLIMTVIPVPDLYRLWEVAQNKGSCQFKWSLFGICPRLLGSRSTIDDRQGVQDDVIAVNNLLAQMASDFSKNIIFTPFAEDVFNWEHISHLDCFHPSVAGQNLISQHSLPDLLRRL